MKNRTIHPFEIVLASLVLMSMLLSSVYFYETFYLNPQEYHPLRTYYENPVTMAISVISLLAKVIFIVSFLLQIVSRFSNSQKIKTCYLLSAFTVGILQLFEMYYSSTFYYGEIPDVNAPGFPLLASLLFALIIWKIFSQKLRKI